MYVDTVSWEWNFEAVCAALICLHMTSVTTDHQNQSQTTPPWNAADLRSFFLPCCAAVVMPALQRSVIHQKEHGNCIHHSVQFDVVVVPVFPFSPIVILPSAITPKLVDCPYTVIKLIFRFPYKNLYWK